MGFYSSILRGVRLRLSDDWDIEHNPSDRKTKKVAVAVGAGVIISIFVLLLLFPAILETTFKNTFGSISIQPLTTNTTNQSLTQQCKDQLEITHCQPTTQGPVIQNPNNLSAERIAKSLHEIVNSHRRNNSIETLTYDARLASLALSHSQDMAQHNYLSHHDNNNNDPSQRASDAGYQCFKEVGPGHYAEGIGENVAQNYVHDFNVQYYFGVPNYTWLTEEELAESIFRQWKESPPHNSNMLNSHYDKEGIGIVIDTDGKVYATQDFC